jgi:hypothetical protein
MIRLLAIRSLLLAIAATAMPAHAYDPNYREFRYGKWVAFKTKGQVDGRPVCGIYTNWIDNQQQLMIKYFNGDTQLNIQIFKTTWRFPKNGTEVPMTIGFDKNPMVQGVGSGSYSEPSHHPMVQFVITDAEQVTGFLHEFGEANQMWVRFEQGNEQQWVADMTGSREAARSFSGCVASLPKVTQPYGPPQASQPYSTQPYKAHPAK